MKRLIVAFSILLVIFTFSSFSYKLPRLVPYKITKVIIDAGHGGHDPGCSGKIVKEKDVALAVALKLGRYIEDNIKDVEVIYTRKTDEFVELHERAAIANNNKADVFICIHCNAGKKEAYGSETYVMGLHRSAENLAVSKRENASILMEENYQQKYDGFDPNSPEANIIFSLYQNAFLDQSLALAANVQSQFKEKVGRFDRGIKQAGFLVLYKTTMPSILIETGFLTNQEEEKFLSSEQGQDYIASAIYRAFKEYKAEMEGGVKENIAKKPKEVEKNNFEKPNESINKEVKSDRETLPPSSINNESVVSGKKEMESSNTISTKPEVASVKKESGNINVSVIFRVQVATSSKQISVNAEKFKVLEQKVEFEKTPEGVYKYIVGEHADFHEAVKLQKQVRDKGFSDAFVVAYHDRKRISISEALSLIKKE